MQHHAGEDSSLVILTVVYARIGRYPYRMAPAVAEEMRVLSFQSLVTVPRGRELARLLANALMARQIAQNANVHTTRSG